MADPVFNITDNRERCLTEKKLSVASQPCFLEWHCNQEIYDAVCNYIVENYPRPLYEPWDFDHIAMQIEEDLAIHRMNEDADWLAATHICFPSSWAPEEKIGKPFDVIHEPIPGMNLKNSKKLVEAMIMSGPYERFVWGLIYEDELNYHPSKKRKSFDANNPFFLVKVERQIMISFPEHQAMLFVLKQYYLKEKEVDKQALLKSLLSMTDEQKKYKGITEDLIKYVN